jgi:hypothetical protein
LKYRTATVFIPVTTLSLGEKKMKSFAKSAIALLAFALVVNAQTNSPAAWTPELQIKTRTVGAPRVS